MRKKILILTASARENGNSSRMAQAFAEGARKAGHVVTFFDTANSSIKPCRACDACFQTGSACVCDDDFNILALTLADAEVVVLATPLYWYSFPAGLKAALDKMYAFVIGDRRLRIQESVLLACGEIERTEVFDGLRRSYELIAQDRGWTDRGQVIVPNVNRVGDIEKTDALEQISQLAQQI